MSSEIKVSSRTVIFIIPSLVLSSASDGGYNPFVFVCMSSPAIGGRAMKDLSVKFSMTSDCPLTH